MLTDALKRVLVQRPENVEAIATKLIECAKDGESWAQQLIFDRIDGKVPQPIVGDDDEPPITVREILIRAIQPDDRPAQEGQ